MDLHRYKQLAVPLDRVKENFARYGLLDEQVIFSEGLFGDTVPALTAGAFALIRLDGDLYESTDIALRALYPKLSPGGFVVVDDFGRVQPCRKAVIDYRSAMGIDHPIHEADASGVWWQKGAAAGDGLREGDLSARLT